MPDTEYQLVYWPTARVCVTYGSRGEAAAALAWYEKTFGPLYGAMGIRERSPVLLDVPANKDTDE